MLKEGWTFEQLAQAGWAPVHNAYQDYVNAGFRLRSLGAQVFMPMWLDAFDRAFWTERRTAGRAERLSRAAERVQARGDEDLVAAHRLGGVLIKLDQPGLSRQTFSDHATIPTHPSSQPRQPEHPIG